MDIKVGHLHPMVNMPPEKKIGPNWTYWELIGSYWLGTGA